MNVKAWDQCGDDTECRESSLHPAPTLAWPLLCAASWPAQEGHLPHPTLSHPLARGALLMFPWRWPQSSFRPTPNTNQSTNSEVPPYCPGQRAGQVPGPSSSPASPVATATQCLAVGAQSDQLTNRWALEFSQCGWQQRVVKEAWPGGSSLKSQGLPGTSSRGYSGVPRRG